MSVLLLAANTVLGFFGLCFVVILVWRFVAGVDANGVLVIPDSLAVGTVVVYVVGLLVFAWRNRRSIRNEIIF